MRQALCCSARLWLWLQTWPLPLASFCSSPEAVIRSPHRSPARDPGKQQAGDPWGRDQESLPYLETQESLPWGSDH